MKPPKSKRQSTSAAAATDKTGVCIFCDSTFPTAAADLITGAEDLERISELFIEEFEIAKCEFVIDGRGRSGTSPFCPSCTKLVRKMDEMCTQVKRLRRDIDHKKKILAESAVNTFVYADVNGPFFMVKHMLFGRWSEAIQANDIAAAGRERGRTTGSESESAVENGRDGHSDSEEVAVAIQPHEQAIVTAPVGHASKPKKPFAGPLSKKRKYEDADSVAAEVPPPEPAPSLSTAIGTDGDNEEDARTPVQTKKSPGSGPVLSEKQKLDTLATMMFNTLKRKQTEPPKPTTATAATTTTYTLTAVPPAKKDKPGPASKKKQQEPDQPAAAGILTPGALTTSTKQVIIVNSEDEDSASESDEECKICHKICRTKELRKKHMLSHEGNERPHKCGDCGKTFFAFGSLKRHSTETHGKRLTSPAKASPAAKKSSAPAPAKQKQQPPARPDGVVRVRLDFGARGDVSPRPQPPPISFDCPHCEKKFPLNKRLRKHVHQVHKKKSAGTGATGAQAGPKLIKVSLYPGASDDVPKSNDASKISYSPSAFGPYPVVDRKEVERYLDEQKRRKTGSDAEQVPEPVAPSPSPQLALVPDLEPQQSTSKATTSGTSVVWKKDGAWFSQAQNQNEKPKPRTKRIPLVAPTLLKSKTAPTESQLALIRKQREKTKHPAPASVQRRWREAEEESEMKPESSSVPENKGEEPEVPEAVDTAMTAAGTGPGTTTSASYWENPASILASTAQTSSSTSILTPTLITPSPLPAGNKLAPIKPASLVAPSAIHRRGRKKAGPKKQTTAIQLMKKRLEKNLAAAGVGKKITTLPLEFDPTTNLVPLGRQGQGSSRVEMLNRSAWGSSTSAGAPIRTASSAPPRVYVANGAAAVGEEEEDFDPTMFLEVGTAAPTRAKPSQPMPKSKLPPGIKIVNLQNIIGGATPKIPPSTPAPVAAPDEEDCPIRICNIRSLCSTPLAPDEDDEVEVIHVAAGIPKAPVPPVIPALGLGLRPADINTNASRLLRSPFRRSIAPKISTNVVPTCTPLQEPPGPTRVREVMLPPVQPYAARGRKGPAPASVARARVATVTDTTTFKPSASMAAVPGAPGGI